MTERNGDRGVRRALLAGLILFEAGIVRDLQWHATHDTQRQFETASKQVEVHWLLWLGMVVLLLAGWAAIRRSRARWANAGYRVLLLSALVYVPVSVWHFIEHASGADPQLAHVFLYAASLGASLGAVYALLSERRAGVAPRADAFS